MKKKCLLIATLVAVLMLFSYQAAGQKLAGGNQDVAVEDELYNESFWNPLISEELQPQPVMSNTAESVFIIVTVTNTYTTGHGNVQFRILWNANTGRYQALIWSMYSYYHNYYPWCIGYRQWFDPPAATYFANWPKRGGALCVGWPPTYSGMNKSLQVLDVDQDGDFDVFQLIETSPMVWKIYLYKNNN